MRYIIENLSQKNLKSATVLRDKVFDDLGDDEKDTLIASLYPTKYKSYLQKHEIESLEYWVLQDVKHSKVVGLIGLYKEYEDESLWVGWFCVAPDYRGLGLGRKLLDFVVQKAKTCRKNMRLYTHNSQMYQKAIKTYKEYGFKPYTPEFKIDKDELYMQKITY